MKDFLKKLVGTVAPNLAAALGGPLAGSAVKVLADKLGLNTENKTAEDMEDEIVSQLQIASPEVWQKIKEGEREFKVKMRELGIDEQKLHHLDRQSARQMQIETKDKMPSILASIVMALFAFVLAAEFMIVFQQVGVDANAEKILHVTLGILLAAVTQVLNFYFGSSVGSKRKTEIFANGNAVK